MRRWFDGVRQLAAAFGHASLLARHPVTHEQASARKAAASSDPYTLLDCMRGISSGSYSYSYTHWCSGTGLWKSPKGMNLVAGGNAPGSGGTNDHDPARVEVSEPHAVSIRPFQGRAVCWLRFRGRCPRLLNGALAGLNKGSESMLCSGKMRIRSRGSRRTPKLRWVVRLDRTVVRL